VPLSVYRDAATRAPKKPSAPATNAAAATGQWPVTTARLAAVVTVNSVAAGIAAREIRLPIAFQQPK